VIAMRARLRSTLVRFSAGAFVLLQGAALSPLKAQPLPHMKTALVEFENSAFPYRGDIPEKNLPFLDAADGDRRGHTTPRGGVYWEETYNDHHVLLSIPKGFDPKKPALIVLYFHGNQAKLSRDVRDRQQVPRQVAESGLNAVLVAPQLAVNAADSSSGRFWEPDFFARFLDEAAERLAKLYGDESARAAFASAPVAIVAYSGGYQPAVWSVHAGGATERVRGMIFLDALYAESDKVAAWLVANPSAFFISAYTHLTREENDALQKLLVEQKVQFQPSLPPRLAEGSIAFVANGDDVVHNDFVTKAWINDPVKNLLARVPGFSRAEPPKPTPAKPR
jgi:hypothetical protein